jgi:hypothetical protein
MAFYGQPFSLSLYAVFSDTRSQLAGHPNRLRRLTRPGGLQSLGRASAMRFEVSARTSTLREQSSRDLEIASAVF